MNIILSPSSNISFKEAVQYSRTFKEVLDAVYKKFPTFPRLTITIDDTSCNHRFEPTGETVHGSVKIQCAKCGVATYVHKRS